MKNVIEYIVSFNNSEIFLKQANNLLGTDYNDWEEISRYQYLTEEFMREYQDYVDWTIICIWQKLSIEFMIEFKDKIDWTGVSLWQEVSESFILRFRDKLNVRVLKCMGKLPKNLFYLLKDKK